MLVLDYFSPKTLEKIYSSINGEIKVVKFQNKISVWAGGYQQSGPLVEKIWRDLPQAKNALILGLGCGSVLKSLKAERVTGVEIDPAMIAIGKKHFNLKNIKIIIDSGRAVLARMATKFDLIIVDMYRGGKITDLIIPTRNLADNGTIIFNQLFNIDLVSSLDKIPDLKIKEIKKFEYNKLIICSKK